MVQIQSICRRQQRNLTEKLKFLLGRVENILGKKEKMLVTSIFSFSPKCFQKCSLSGSLKVRLNGKALNKMNVARMMIYVFDTMEDVLLKKCRKYWLTTFSSFPTMFTIALYSRGHQN